MAESPTPIYLDNAATTPLLPEVLQAMEPYFCRRFGNPSALYSLGREARAAVDNARRQVANALGAAPEEIYFTSGGSEADNWALRGAARLCVKKGGHIISTAFEHHAVLHTLRALRADGFEVTLLRPDPSGRVSPDDLKAALRPDTVLVSVMTANNEIGTIQPIPELARICRQRGVLFHTDAVQAAGHLPLSVKELGVDLLSLSAHKFHGPKGVGALYCRAGLRLPNLIEGGAQERGRRAGTENVPGVVGLGKALELAVASLDKNTARVTALRERLLGGLLSIDGVSLNGAKTGGLPGTVNVRVAGVESEPLLMLLDMAGICASAGSACAAGAVEPSHVLTALGLSREQAAQSLRFSLSEQNTPEEADTVCRVMREQIARLRALTAESKAR